MRRIAGPKCQEKLGAAMNFSVQRDRRDVVGSISFSDTSRRAHEHTL